jgi:hypothetical protein
VSTRVLLLAAVVVGFATSHAFAQATSVTLQLFPFTGEVRFLNKNTTDFMFVIYSLTSPSGALNGTDGVWTSIADTYDANDNGFIDPVNNWVELSASATNLHEVTEGAFTGPGGTLRAQRSVSLGKIWNPNIVPVPDIGAQVFLPNEIPAAVTVRRAIDGDYNEDRVVDEEDFIVWKTFFGMPIYLADGNIDGIIDAADYTVWRDNLGLSLPAFGDEELGAGGVTLSASAVPEPSSLILALAAGGGWLLGRARRRGRFAS